MSECRRLYATYKSVCDLVGLKSITPTINIDIASEDELSKYFSDLMNEYALLRDCYEGRVNHRLRCIRKEEYDPGHNYLLLMLLDRMNRNSSLMDQIYDKLEDLANEQRVVEIEEEPTRKTSQRRTSKSPTRERLRSKDRSTDYVDEKIRLELKLRRDVLQSNFRLILLMAYANPQIWRIVVPLAIEYNNVRILREALNLLRFLKDPLKMADLDRRIEDYALQHDVPSLLRIPTPAIWFDDPNSYLDEKVLLYLKKGGPKITEAVYRHILNDIKQLPKPITDPYTLNKLTTLIKKQRNPAIDNIHDLILKESLSLQAIRNIIYDSQSLSRPSIILPYIEEYTKQLDNEDFIRLFSDNALVDQLKAANDLGIALRGLAAIMEGKAGSEMMAVAELYRDKILPIIKVLILSELRDRKK